MDFGCSSFSWETENGLHLLGRTYDQFGDLAANRVIAVPRGVPCAPGMDPERDAAPGRYAYTGMAVLGFGSPVVVDGVNEAGLMGALLHYPEYAFYAPAGSGGAAVHPGRLLARLLSRCAGVEEAAEEAGRITLEDGLIQGRPLPAHYILSDRQGRTLVIEPDREGLRIHRDSIGVLTNSPHYLWHLTHLRCYAGAANLSPDARGAAGWELRPFGFGCGFGLPGDYSSPSRFVRLAFLKAFAVRGRDELDGVSRMFRIFAPVEIPEGLAGSGPGSGAYHQTLCTSVMCAESGVYYFSPAQNRRISAVRLTAEGQRTREFPLGDRQDLDFRN